MKKLISRLQKDFANLQATLHKEGNDLLEKIKKVDIKDNLDSKKKELEKIIDSKLKKLEPAYHSFVDELRKNAKKAGIDIGKIERELKKTAGAAKQTIEKRMGKKTRRTKAKGNKPHKVSKTAKAGSKAKTAAKKKTSRKKTTRQKSS